MISAEANKNAARSSLIAPRISKELTGPTYPVGKRAKWLPAKILKKACGCKQGRNLLKDPDWDGEKNQNQILA